MPLDCDHRRRHGADICHEHCRALDSGTFLYVRIDGPDELPEPIARVIDVHVLDMNHGWPNVGHDALVMAVRTVACDLAEALARARLRVRVVSYDVRRGRVLPPAPDRMGGIYIGTGGPGHLDPAENDGVKPGSQGILEDPSWEAPLFALFDAIRAVPEAALIGVCHTFGVMCRWLGVADPVLRGEEKGGKSTGISENLLTPEAGAHPWFRGLVDESPNGARIRILDSRLYDLVPRPDMEATVTPLGFETLGPGGPPGHAVTMWEADRDVTDRMPRVFGVNHHPEIVDRARVLMLLWQKRARGEVSHEWYAERAHAMTVTLRDHDADRRLDLTSAYTLFGPLRYSMHRQARLRAASLGVALGDHLGSDPGQIARAGLTPSADLGLTASDANLNLALGSDPVLEV
jgi:hypothetical protein